MRQTLAAALRSFCRRNPFRRFAVELLTGERWEIIHPEAIVWRGELLYFVAADDRPHLLDSTSILQVFDASPPPTQSQATNSQSDDSP